MHQKNVNLAIIGFLKILGLKDMTIMSAKGNTYRCILMGISKNKSLKRLNNSVTYDRRVS